MSEISENLSVLKIQLEEIENNIQNLFSSYAEGEKTFEEKIKKYQVSIPLLGKKSKEIAFEQNEIDIKIRSKKKNSFKHQDKIEKLKKLEGALGKKINDGKKVLQSLKEDSKEVLGLKANIDSLKSEKKTLKNLYKEKELVLEESKVKNDVSKASDESEGKISGAGNIIIDKYKRLIDAVDKVGSGFYEGGEIDQAMKFYKEVMADGSVKLGHNINKTFIDDINGRLRRYEINYNEQIEDLQETHLNIKILVQGKTNESQKMGSEIDELTDKVNQESGEFVGGSDFFVSFCDVLSVLLCFFVVFFAISDFDYKKFQAFVSTWNDKKIEFEMPFNASLSESELKLIGKAKELVSAGVDPETIVRNDTNVLQFVFPNKDLFVRGGVRVSAEGLNILSQKLEEILFVGGIRQIRISGHINDDVLSMNPKLSQKYSNNFALSAELASSVARVLNGEFKFPENSTIITGYGARQPLKLSSLNSEKDLNSRIEIEVEIDKTVKKA